jgi:hypothetical protein
VLEKVIEKMTIVGLSLTKDKEEYREQSALMSSYFYQYHL